jgi:hypothetical protein
MKTYIYNIRGYYKFILQRLFYWKYETSITFLRGETVRIVIYEPKTLRTWLRKPPVKYETVEMLRRQFAEDLSETREFPPYLN